MVLMERELEVQPEGDGNVAIDVFAPSALPLSAAVLQPPLVISPQTSLEAVLSLIQQPPQSAPVPACASEMAPLRCPLDEERTAHIFVYAEHKLVGYLSNHTVCQWMVDALERPNTTAEVAMLPIPITVSVDPALEQLPTPTELLRLFRIHSVEVLLVVDPAQHPIGLITRDSLKHHCEARQWLATCQIADIPLTSATCLPADTPPQVLAAHFTKSDIEKIVLLEPHEASQQRPQILGVLTRSAFLRGAKVEASKVPRGAEQLLLCQLPIMCLDQSLLSAFEALQETSENCLIVINDEGDFCGLMTYDIMARVVDNWQKLPGSSAFETLDSCLQTTIDREQELSQLKQHFIAHASHEFRTPLAIIASSAGILRDFSDKLTEAKKQSHFQRIQSSIHRATKLLDDMLLINPTTARQHNCNTQPLNIIAWCQTFIEDLKQSNLKRTLAFDVKGMDADDMMEAQMVLADETLLRQVLSNVVSNALKYSLVENTVTVGLQLSQDWMRFNISDTGIGIPDAAKPYIFQPFFRADNVDHISGTGLGLTIAKNCTERQGGYLHISSHEGKGTSVSVIIPRG